MVWFWKYGLVRLLLGHGEHNLLYHLVPLLGRVERLADEVN